MREALTVPVIVIATVATIVGLTFTNLPFWFVLSLAAIIGMLCGWYLP